MTVELSSENEILKDEIYLLIKAYKDTINDIKNTNINNHDKTEVLSIMVKHMDSVVNKYPKIKELM